MHSQYEKFINSELMDELKKVHRLELKIRLQERKAERTWREAMMNMNDTQLLKILQNDYPPNILNSKLVNTIRNTNMSKLKYLKNYNKWRNTSIFYKDLQKAYGFQVATKRILVKFKTIGYSIQS